MNNQKNIIVIGGGASWYDRGDRGSEGRLRGQSL